jgi:hypothetical protein
LREVLKCSTHTRIFKGWADEEIQLSSEPLKLLPSPQDTVSGVLLATVGVAAAEVGLRLTASERRTAPQVFEQQEPRPGDYAEVYADTTKINTELNWTAQFVDLRDGMATAWKWRKHHPYGY